MSLINDALKKARNQTNNADTLSAATGKGGAAHAGFNQPKTLPAFLPWAVVGLLIFVLVLTCAMLAMLLFYQSQPQTTQSGHSEAAAASPAALEAPAEAKTAVAADSKAAAIALAEDKATEAQEVANSVAQAPMVIKPESAAEVTGPEMVADPQLSAPSAADLIETTAGDKTPSPAVVHWLAESTVNGVRVAGQLSRVMLNGKSYRLGETVHYELGITIRAIQENRVLFEDGRGVNYVKHF